MAECSVPSNFPSSGPAQGCGAPRRLALGRPCQPLGGGGPISPPWMEVPLGVSIQPRLPILLLGGAQAWPPYPPRLPQPPLFRGVGAPVPAFLVWGIPTVSGQSRPPISVQSFFAFFYRQRQKKFAHIKAWFFYERLCKSPVGKYNSPPWMRYSMDVDIGIEGDTGWL